MSTLESLADLFRPKIIVTSRRAMKNRNYKFLFFIGEIGHPHGTKHLRWMAKRNRDYLVGHTSDFTTLPKMELVEKCPVGIEARCGDPEIWQAKYESQGRDGIQYIIGMVEDGKCRWRELWNPEVECKSVKLAKAIFHEIE